MFTLFACPKPFTRPHIAIIQRNAILSWTRLEPRPEILLFGDDAGVGEIADELGLRYLPQIARNEYGTPLISDVFRQAQQASKYDYVAYVNSDIILLNDFPQAVVRLQREMPRGIMIGLRRDLDMREPLDFGARWEEWLRTQVSTEGRLMVLGSDYFVFRRGFYAKMPAFALGRPYFDNWLMWNVRHRRYPLVNATDSVLAIHQLHMQPGETEKVYNRPESLRNYAMAGAWVRSFRPGDATHEMAPDRIRRRFWRARKNRWREIHGIVNPWFRGVVKRVLIFLGVDINRFRKKVKG